MCDIFATPNMLHNVHYKKCTWRNMPARQTGIMHGKDLQPLPNINCRAALATWFLMNTRVVHLVTVDCFLDFQPWLIKPNKN
jgi:hypothetical protein